MGRRDRTDEPKWGKRTPPKSERAAAAADLEADERRRAAGLSRSAEALREAGYPDEGTARGLRDNDFLHHDLFVCMDRSHVRDVVARGAPKGRVVLIREFDPRRGHDDVPDPYYGGREGFTDMIRMLESAMDGLVARVRDEIARKRGGA